MWEWIPYKNFCWKYSQSQCVLVVGNGDSFCCSTKSSNMIIWFNRQQRRCECSERNKVNEYTYCLASEEIFHTWKKGRNLCHFCQQSTIEYYRRLHITWILLQLMWFSTLPIHYKVRCAVHSEMLFVYHSWKQWLFQLLYPSCQLESDWPLINKAFLPTELWLTGFFIYFFLKTLETLER